MKANNDATKLAMLALTIDMVQLDETAARIRARIAALAKREGIEVVSSSAA